MTSKYACCRVFATGKKWFVSRASHACHTRRVTCAGSARLCPIRLCPSPLCLITELFLMVTLCAAYCVSVPDSRRAIPCTTS